MISFLAACERKVEQGAKRAAVCSSPPSEVGVGITDFVVMEFVVVVSGRK